MKKNKCKKNNTFGLQLALLLKSANISQTKLASMTNISRVSINRYLKGQTDIRASDVIKMLAATGIDLEEIVYNHLRKTSHAPQTSEDMAIGQDIENLFRGLEHYERKTYVSYLLNHAKILNPEIPRDVLRRLSTAI